MNSVPQTAWPLQVVSFGTPFHPDEAAVQQAFARLGARFEAVGVSWMARRGGLQPTVSAYATTFPTEWLARYVQHGHHAADPVLRHVEAAVLPYTWSEALAAVGGRAAAQVLADGVELGMRSGYAVPLRGPGMLSGCVSIASGLDPAALADRLAGARGEVLLAAYELQDTMARAFAPEQVGGHLTERERECLQWSAMGKSKWEIGEILGISESTVAFHMKNAMRKLGATRRELAITRALSEGLIDPPES